MRKTDPELIDEIIRVTKLVLNEIRDKYRFEIVTMQQKTEEADELIQPFGRSHILTFFP